MRRYAGMRMSPAATGTAALLALAALAALATQFSVNFAEDRQDGVLRVAWRMARYFTILTNGIVCVVFARAALTGRAPGPVMAGGVTLWIGITGAVYYALLYRETQGLETLADIGLHGVVPAGTVLWWLAYAEKRGLGVRAAALWLLWPAGYVLYALARGERDGRYPYFFTDPHRIGWDGVALWSLGLCAAFFLAGLGLAWLARRAPGPGRRDATAGS